MTTDDLRELYGKQVSKYCWSAEDYVFTDDYVLWLEEKILDFNKPCKTFLSNGQTTSATICQFCGKEKHEH